MAHKKEDSAMEIVSCKPISTEEVRKELGTFLKKRHVREGLSNEDILRLRRLQQSLKLRGPFDKQIT